MSAAFGERYLVMDFLGSYQDTSGLAQFTHRMLLDIAVTNTLPRPSIPTAYSRVTVVLLVAFGFQLGVFLAEPAIRQLGASGVRAGALGFPWHHFTSSWA